MCSADLRWILFLSVHCIVKFIVQVHFWQMLEKSSDNMNAFDAVLLLQNTQYHTSHSFSFCCSVHTTRLARAPASRTRKPYRSTRKSTAPVATPSAASTTLTTHRRSYELAGSIWTTSYMACSGRLSCFCSALSSSSSQFGRRGVISYEDDSTFLYGTGISRVIRCLISAHYICPWMI